MGRSEENAGFWCARCGAEVQPLTNGSYRNHCPACLWSKHVDRVPGDRASDCGGMMRPVEARITHKGAQLVHQCTVCGAVRVNRAAQRTAQPDDIESIAELLWAAPTHRNSLTPPATCRSRSARALQCRSRLARRYRNA